MSDTIHGFVIGSVHEHDRQVNIQELQKKLPGLQYEEAVYPAYVHVPFLNKIQELSQVRTGQQLQIGEIGCLLSHRNIWHKIVQSDAPDGIMFLVMESDSGIKREEVLTANFARISDAYDLFFWGAWEGHMQVYRSTRKQLSPGIDYGTPFIKTVYCTYGYSLNKKAAAYLLKQTRKAGYPVDQFKRFIQEGELRIGGVVPEVIATIPRNESYIRGKRNALKEYLFFLVLDCKNWIICLFR